MKYRTTINLTITEWQNNDPSVTIKIVNAYRNLLIDNKLSPYDYQPILGWTYENDDFIKNRITLLIEAKSVLQVDDNGNYKDVKK